jgi:hypothetical protein
MARFRKSYSYGLFDKVGDAFRALRRQGLAAYHPDDLGDSSCCGGCAISVISSDLEDQPDKKGCVFYHDQDRESGQESGEMCIRYSSRSEGSDADTVAVGNLVAEALRKQGLVVDWDGNPNRAITVAMSH